MSNVSVTVHSLKNQNDAVVTLISPVMSDLSLLASLMLHTGRSNGDTLTINNNKSRIFSCNDNDTFLQQLQIQPYVVKITLNERDQYGVASCLDSTRIIVNYLISPPSTHQSEPLKTLHVSHSISESWYSISELHEAPINTYKLKMSPPVQSSPVKIIDHEDVINDPFDYFLDKYFSNLYLLSTPLTVFTKSVFARLRAICLKDLKFYESILSQFVMRLDQFDQRHSALNNGLLNSSTLFEKEEIYRKEFIAKSLNLVDFDIHSQDYQETNRSLGPLLSGFKVKETQLQILILLELIEISDRDDKRYFKPVKMQKPKRKLVGKKKITPILNGMGIDTGRQRSTSLSMEQLSYNQLLDLYIEKLAINDLLNGSSSNENYTPKFINYTVVPFFEKKCPHSVRHMIKKIKGPSFKPPDSKQVDKTRKRDKVSKPILQRSQSTRSRLEDIEELNSSLVRSNSELESLKRVSSFNSKILSKREIDVSVPVFESKPLKTSNSQIFNRVGKRTASTTSLRLTKSYSQIEATPIKKGKIVDIINTPNDNVKNTQGQIPGSAESVVIEDSGSVLDTAVCSSPIAVRTLGSPINVRSNPQKKEPSKDFTESSPRLVDSPVTAKNVRRRLFAPSKT